MAAKQLSLVFYARNILPGAGIDFNDFPDLDKQRNSDYGTGFQSGWFTATARRITTDAWIGLGNSQFNKIGWRD